MKSSLPALVFSSALASTTQLSAASNECVDDHGRNTDLGHALGVLVYDSIVREYSEFVTVEDIAVGLKHARDRNTFPLSGTASFESNPDAAQSESMSVSDARDMVANWRPQADQLSQQFLSEYKKLRGTQQKSGILTYRLQLEAEGEEQLSRCTANFLLTPEEGANQVCYLQVRIDSSAVCDMKEHVRSAIAGESWTYGEFQSDGVIEGWVQAFRLLKNRPLARADKSSDAGSSATSSDDEVELLEVLEVVIPPEMGYGRKGMAGKVGPDETLWFVMAVK